MLEVGDGDNDQYANVNFTIEESDDGASWSTMAGPSFSDYPFFGTCYSVVASRTKRFARYVLAMTPDTASSMQRFSIFAADIEDNPAEAPPPQYIGRIQQGSELVVVLQAADVYGHNEDPSSSPWVEIYRDGTTPALVESRRIPSDMRRVEDGVFRLPLFLDTLYTTEGRYLFVMKWLDASGTARTAVGSFHLLPGGSADGSVIALYSLVRQDAAYLMMQCDSGRLVRKRNPR